MTGLETLLARVALGLAAAAVSIVLVSPSRRSLWLLSLPRQRFDRALFACFATSRLGLFALVFLVLRIAPRGDVPAFYFGQARQVLAHRLPYRDFISSYAPLHPYLDAALISIWRSPLAIMLVSVLIELLLLPLWLRAGREFLPETDLRIASLLYLASPISLQFVTIDGQDNVVIAVLIALSLLLLLRSRVFASGVAFASSIAGIKFLPLLYAPAFFVAAGSSPPALRRWRFFCGAAAVLAIVYGTFALIHAPVLTPLAAEGDLRSAGDIPYVVEALFGISLPARLTDGCLILALLALFLWIARAASQASIAARTRALTFGMAALTLAFLALSKKSWPPYLMLALFPVCLAASAGPTRRHPLRIVAFAVFGVVALAEHSYWASSLAQFSSAEFHRALVLRQSSAFLLLALELALIAGYLWLLRESVRRILPSAFTTNTPD